VNYRKNIDFSFVFIGFSEFLGCRGVLGGDGWEVENIDFHLFLLVFQGFWGAGGC
jgi:hypothetical protein